MSPFPPPSNIKNITDADDDGGGNPPVVGRKAVIFFWASWHADSSPGGEIDKVYATLSKQSSLVTSLIDFYRVEAESSPDLCQKVCSVSSVFPSTVSCIVHFLFDISQWMCVQYRQFFHRHFSHRHYLVSLISCSSFNISMDIFAIPYCYFPLFWLHFFFFCFYFALNFT